MCKISDMATPGKGSFNPQGVAIHRLHWSRWLMTVILCALDVLKYKNNQQPATKRCRSAVPKF